jgi:VIT1/CCC1 family predicted Fe2+/Mn2+ transporter
MTVAKAVAAFVLAVITALFASGTIPIPASWQLGLGLVGAVCTAIVTYAVPNKPTNVTVLHR